MRTSWTCFALLMLLQGTVAGCGSGSGADGAGDAAPGSEAGGSDQAAPGDGPGPAGDLPGKLKDGPGATPDHALLSDQGAAICPAKPLAAGDHLQTIQFGGNGREFKLHVPKSLKPGAAAPLVLDFHGYVSDMDQQRAISGFLQKADEQGFVVAHGNGYGALRSWNAGGCCGDAASKKLDDVGLAKAIAQQVAGLVCIDPKRVYSTGLSNGGMLSQRLACEAAGTFAAVAPVSGGISLAPMSACQPSRPMPVIEFHGTSDIIVPLSAATDTFGYWAKVDGCTGSATQTFSQGKATCKTYASCKAGVKLTLCLLDAGHIAYDNKDKVSIASLAWDFFKQFSLP